MMAFQQQKKKESLNQLLQMSQIHKYPADPEKSFFTTRKKNMCSKGDLLEWDSAYTVQSTGVSRDVNLISLCMLVIIKQGPSI